MNTRHLVDPELGALVDLLPDKPLSQDSLGEARERVAQAVELIKAITPAYPAIEVFERHVPGPAGAPEVRVLVYRPRAAPAALPALLWIHGGGYVVGNPEGDDWEAKKIVDAVGCVLVSVDYRLAPENPYPAPLDDCYAALKWLHAEAAELGVDRARIGIAGVSAGGGLCAALGLLARDRGEIALCFQAPLQPMLDDRHATAAYSHPHAGQYVWKQEFNHFGWSALLGHEPGREDVAPYAAPARAQDLAGLPPTFISIGALDLFVEEDIEYARRLIRAGVPTELHVYPGAFHGFNLLGPTAQVSQAYQRDIMAALRRGLRVDAEPAAQPEPNPALMAQLADKLPGIPQQDLARFAQGMTSREPYAPGPDATVREGVPRGSLRSAQCAPGAIYPGVAHDYTVYVPAQLDAGKPAALMVFQDGARYLGPEIDTPAVLDNLIHAGAMPPTVAVFVNPGAKGPGLPIYGGADNRSVEYDSLGDAYARFLLEELLPEATQGLTISSDPRQRAIVGLSSGGICAFNAAWERPDAFGKVVSHCGSFVNIRGGHELASAVRRGARKKLRVFLQTGKNDLNIVFGNWVNGNRELAAALDYQGYDYQLTVGEGGHSLAHGGAIFPDTLRWLWREGDA
jgi:acetyl esterase/lipase/enterochelin esterase-like enzyme